jgi:hypothetical protein
MRKAAVLILQGLMGETMKNQNLRVDLLFVKVTWREG